MSREALIKLASNLPLGSDSRKALLKKAVSMKVSSGGFSLDPSVAYSNLKYYWAQLVGIQILDFMSTKISEDKLSSLSKEYEKALYSESIESFLKFLSNCKAEHSTNLADEYMADAKLLKLLESKLDSISFGDLISVFEDLKFFECDSGDEIEAEKLYRATLKSFSYINSKLKPDLDTNNFHDFVYDFVWNTFAPAVTSYFHTWTFSSYKNYNRMVNGSNNNNLSAFTGGFYQLIAQIEDEVEYVSDKGRDKIDFYLSMVNLVSRTLKTSEQTPFVVGIEKLYNYLKDQPSNIGDTSRENDLENAIGWIKELWRLIKKVKGSLSTTHKVNPSKASPQTAEEDLQIVEEWKSVVRGAVDSYYSLHQQEDIDIGDVLQDPDYQKFTRSPAYQNSSADFPDLNEFIQEYLKALDEIDRM